MVNKMNKRKMTILIIISISIFTGIVSGTENNQSSIRSPIVYKSLIDTSGFYKISNMTSNKIAPFQNNTLNIYKGDKIIWVNEESSEKRFTIISGQKLWKNESGILGGRDKQFSYVFNKTGKYTVYLKEYPGLKSQRIIVRLLNITKTNTKASTAPTTPKKTTKPPKKTDKKTVKTTKNVGSTSSNNSVLPVIIILMIIVLLAVSFKYREKIKEKIKEYKDKKN